MKNTNKAEIVGEVLALVLAFFMFFAGIGFGIHITSSFWKKSAVAHGCAHWVVDASGQTTCVWNNDAKEAKE